MEESGERVDISRGGRRMLHIAVWLTVFQRMQTTCRQHLPAARALHTGVTDAEADDEWQSLDMDDSNTDRHQPLYRDHRCLKRAIRL